METAFLNSNQKNVLYKIKGLFRQAKVPFNEQNIIHFVSNNVADRKTIVLEIRFFPAKDKNALVYNVGNFTVAIGILQAKNVQKVLVNFKKEESK